MYGLLFQMCWGSFASGENMLDSAKGIRHAALSKEVW